MDKSPIIVRSISLKLTALPKRGLHAKLILDEKPLGRRVRGGMNRALIREIKITGINHDVIPSMEAFLKKSMSDPIVSDAAAFTFEVDPPKGFLKWAVKVDARTAHQIKRIAQDAIEAAPRQA